MNNLLIEIIVLLLGIPIGFLLSWMARDELVIGRQWFRMMLIVSSGMAMLFFLMRDYVYGRIFGFSISFIFIVTAVAYLMSFNKTWTKKRI
jgi:hypothetical protein